MSTIAYCPSMQLKLGSPMIALLPAMYQVFVSVSLILTVQSHNWEFQCCVFAAVISTCVQPESNRRDNREWRFIHHINNFLTFTFRIVFLFQFFDAYAHLIQVHFFLTHLSVLNLHECIPMHIHMHILSFHIHCSCCTHCAVLFFLYSPCTQCH